MNKDNNLFSFIRLGLIILICFQSSLYSKEKSQVEVQISRNGKALLDIVIAPNASERIQKVSSEFKNILEKMTGASIVIREGDGLSGIALGIPGQFKMIPHYSRWKELSRTERENYLIQTHLKGIYLLGATELGVEHAVWDFLYRLGYRQFFPGKNWEVIPKVVNLSASFNVSESPDYYSRRIWYGYGPWDYAVEPYKNWSSRNRATAGLSLNTGHAYGNIIREMNREFDEHPEYYALVNHKRDINAQAKFCISNVGLQEVVEKYAIRYFEKSPTADSISVDPSDGGRWCECENCKKMGSVSDRAVFLANNVSKVINQKKNFKNSTQYFKPRLVGMYAYNFHSPPPEISVAPNVVISIATAFTKGGYTVDEIVDGWSEKGAILGVREYFSVNPWDRDMPGKSRGSKPDYLKRIITQFHKKGARFVSAESSDNWGPNGLGYYLASRMLWDLDQADHISELIEDFLTKSFGNAREPMRQYYIQLDGSRTHLMVNDQIGRMFRSLQEARSRTEDEAVLARIDDLILYSQYVHLYHQFTIAGKNNKQMAFENLIKFAYRIRHTMMVHVKALARDLPRRMRFLEIPEDCQWNVKEENNPWKTSTPFSDEELSGILEKGIHNYPVVKIEFEAKEYSENLVPMNSGSNSSKSFERVWTGRGKQEFYTWTTKPNQKIHLMVTGGLIKSYRDRGNVKIRLWQIGGASETGEQETEVDFDSSVVPDGKTYPVNLTGKEPGFYRIALNDGHDMTRITWNEGQHMTVKSSLDKPLIATGRWKMYFYVPKEVKIIGFFGGKNGKIVNPEGQESFDLSGKELGYYSISVPLKMDGKYWRVEHASAPVRLMTVPPYFAKSPRELLLPEEIKSLKK